MLPFAFLNPWRIAIFHRLLVFYLLIIFLSAATILTVILFLETPSTDLLSCLHIIDGIDREYGIKTVKNMFLEQLITRKRNVSAVVFAAKEHQHHTTKFVSPERPSYTNVYSTLLKSEANGRFVRPTVRVSVVNTIPLYFEVVFWLGDTLKRLPDVDLNIVLAEHEYGSEEFLNRLFPAGPGPVDFRDWKAMYLSSWLHLDAPDILFLPACLEGDLDNITGVIPRIKELNSWLKLVCIVHQPMLVLENQELLRDFAVDNRLMLITLGPHVCKHFRSKVFPHLVNMSSAFHGLQFNSMPATFLLPQTNPCLPWEDGGLRNWIDRKFLACFTTVAMHGNFDAKRANYSQVLDEINIVFGKDSSVSSWSQFQLNLLGRHVEQLHVPIPSPLVNRAYRWEELVYDESYYLMHHNLALIPVFDGEEYYTEISSFSVTAALVAGVPLIASRRLLDAYSFLDESVVFLRAESETEADAVDNILKLPREVITEKRRRLAELNERLFQTNLLHFKWILRFDIGRC